MVSLGQRDNLTRKPCSDLQEGWSQSPALLGSVSLANLPSLAGPQSLLVKGDIQLTEGDMKAKWEDMPK